MSILTEAIVMGFARRDHVAGRLEDIRANSFKNFHAKGLDYICLFRSRKLTRKVYFLNGNAAKLPEVVNPHDHRYHFKTTVLVGEMSNSIYKRGRRPGASFELVFEIFDWNTPLNGGDGFTWKGRCFLTEAERKRYSAGMSYMMQADQLHTIRMHADQTIIMLDQYEDVVPIGVPTKTYCLDHKAPSLDGLYEEFTIDEIKARLAVLETLGININPSLVSL